jgi:hypothetical protein
MNKNQLVLTSAMAATLIALPGCSSSDDDWNGDVYAQNDTAVCVDQNGYRVNDNYCDTRSYNGGGGGGHGWYYIGRGGRIPYHGDSVSDGRLGFTGSSTPATGAVYGRAPQSTAMSRSAAVSRGGFGSSGRSFGGGRS